MTRGCLGGTGEKKGGLVKTHGIVVKETHRGLWYENGVLTRMVGPGRYELSAEAEEADGKHSWGRGRHGVEVEVDLVVIDMRERELTIEGQEILTADRAAIQVNVVVQFRVADPKAAVHEVENYERRLGTDARLAVRRVLSAMTIDEILADSASPGDGILRTLKEATVRYGVSILRAEVKDLGFPGDLRETMNTVLAAERLARAQIVKARAEAEIRRIGEREEQDQ
jgi:regulator of protease activity HflC (stomatin/prohibitin superfamily)